jgi:CIC family chloride channel protein
MPVPDAAAPSTADSAAAGSGLPLRLYLGAAIGGLLAGLLGTAFRWVLEWVAQQRDALVAAAHAVGAFGWLLPVGGAALAVALSRFLVRFSPLSGGSGIQYAEAVARGLMMPRLNLDIIPVKFVGGTLSIGAGLALGREGPTVQMAARVGALVARLSALTVTETRMLRSAVAGAGLAVAFNAPTGGAVFVMEELWRGFPPKLVAATVIAVAVAVTVLRVLLGNRADFPVSLALPPAGAIVPALIIGAVLGALGAAYNRAVIGCIDAFHAVRLLPEVKAAAIGALAGLIAWWLPTAVGGGERLVAPLLDDATRPALGALATLLVLRLVLSPVSYAAGTPGGLFAPVIAIGAIAAALMMPALQGAGLAFGLTTAGGVLVGMAAFLAATIRAPLTGLLLVVEMSNDASQLIPMLAACFAAIAVCQWLRSEPIYDTLVRRIGPPEHATERQA